MGTDRREALWMEEALSLARRGLGKVATNPMVGCVLVKGGKVVGRGWHERFGGPHAEIRALKSAGARAKGAAAYVTLEPCCFYGKTPPCTDALIRAGVQKVVAAMTDPDLRSLGRGFAALRRAGLSVRSGLLAAKARELNRAYLVNRAEERPYVLLKAAASLDGKLRTAAGESKWITSQAARAEGHRLRAACDAVLVGVNTVLADDPELTSHGRGRDPVRVVLDTRLRTPPRAKVLRRGGALTVLATASSDPKKTRAFKSPRLSLVRVPRERGRVSLGALLKQLYHMGIGTLLVEGGSATHTSFLAEGLVDEVRLFLAPKLIGGSAAPGFFEGEGVGRLARALKLEELEARGVGGDILISGRIANHVHRHH